MGRQCAPHGCGGLRDRLRDRGSFTAGTLKYDPYFRVGGCESGTIPGSGEQRTCNSQRDKSC